MKWLAVLRKFGSFEFKECDSEQQAREAIEKWLSRLKRSYPNYQFSFNLYGVQEQSVSDAIISQEEASDYLRDS